MKNLSKPLLLSVLVFSCIQTYTLSAMDVTIPMEKDIQAGTEELLEEERPPLDEHQTFSCMSDGTATILFILVYPGLYGLALYAIS